MIEWVFTLLSIKLCPPLFLMEVKICDWINWTHRFKGFAFACDTRKRDAVVHHARVIKIYSDRSTQGREKKADRKIEKFLSRLTLTVGGLILKIKCQKLIGMRVRLEQSSLNWNKTQFHDGQTIQPTHPKKLQGCGGKGKIINFRFGKGRSVNLVTAASFWQLYFNVIIITL